MPPRVIFLLGLVFCWDQRIWAQTDLYSSLESFLVSSPFPSSRMSQEEDAQVLQKCSKVTQLRSAFTMWRTGDIDLPEIYLNPPENGYLPIVIGTSAISVLPLFLLFLLLCHCWCRAKHRATDDETKSQVQYDSSGPGLDFTEDNQCGVSVDIASEGDRQMDTEALPEEDPQDVISVQQHRDSLMGSVDSEFSCTLEESL
ncbi:uncharacterized protein LOC125133454 isoform X1 [Phacochoerus africanus]|uniref:uncharacterized protein LOC125133454 isoform X1 n=1 Tax=Phacochoerus africanus TaxID=41426 RepID=UPI001FD917A5|nr:uncharacterized protein LOC125133454 isoform X1 [Phacochoerus africanus]